MNNITTTTFRLSTIASLALTTFTANTFAGYFTNFDNFTPNSTVSEYVDVVGVPPDWTTTDDNQADLVSFVTGFSTGPSDLVALMGGNPAIGAAPFALHNELWYPLNEGNFTFKVKFDITTSDNVAPSNDSFGWTFRDTTGAFLFQVDFNPKFTGINPDPVNKLDIDWTDSAGTHAANFSIFRNAIYNLEVDGNFGTNTFSAFITDSSSVTTNVIPVGLLNGGPDLGRVAATWDINDPNVANYGSNTLFFDNYSVVPEPTAALFALGGAMLLLMRRPRK